MVSSNFNKNIIPKINEVLKFVLENPYSDFYRNKYKGLNIKEIRSYKDFQKIPFLTKEEFLSVPLEEITFIPKDKITSYSVSSGTTNRNKPAITPKLPFDYNHTHENDFNIEKMKKIGARKILVLWPSMSNTFIRYVSMPQKYSIIIPGDTSNLELSAWIAKETNVQIITATVTILDFFIDHLKKVNFDLKEVKWISLGGEFCSSEKLKYFKSEFPNARIDFRYGSSEIGKIGYRCDELSASEQPNIFHVFSPSDSALIEIERNDIEAYRKTGELIYTHARIRAFPLIRYRTGDMGSLEEKNCSCGNKLVLTLEGRTNHDVFKFYGTTLYSDLIAKAISATGSFLEPQFQMHVFEEKTKDKLKPRLELHLKLKKEFQGVQNPLLKKDLEEKISSQLRLSPKSTLKQLVEKNIFLPLTVVFVESWPDGQSKSRNIISHFQ